jgi:putative PIN family toxin of toxin-antitoxin system
VLKVVVDPGVLVSALISPSGPPADLRRAWREGLFDLVVSPMLLDELGRVLWRDRFRRYVSLEDAARYVAALERDADVVADPANVPQGLTADPGDDYLVALCRAAGAILVSGDAHLVGLPGVLTPRALAEVLGRSA